MSVAPNATIIDFGTFASPTAGVDGVQGQVPQPLAGQQNFVLTAVGWVSGGAIPGLGTMAVQNANNVAITGGAIDGTTIGGSTPAAGTFTTLTSTSTAQFGTGSANSFRAVGAAATFAPVLSTQGSDANVSFVLQSKGTGAVDIAAGSGGVNVSNGGTVTAITTIARGSNYTSYPTITISPPTTAGGVQATASAVLNLASATLASGGTGYSVNDVLTFSGVTGTAPTVRVDTVSGGVITAFTITGFGAGNVQTPLPSNPVSVTGGTGSGATFTASWNLGNITITNAGSGYAEQPTVSFSGGGGSGAAAYATVGGGATVKSIGNTLTFATPNSSVLAIVDKNSSGNNPTNTTVAFSMVPQQSAFGASYLGFGAAAYLGTVSTSSSAFLFATSVSSPVSNGGGGVTQFGIAHTASAVNYVQVTGNTTTNNPTISAQGSDTNISINYNAKGTGQHFFQSAGANTFQIGPGGGQANRLRVQSSAAGFVPIVDAVGTDTNIPILFQTKGTGAINLAPGSSGVNVSNGGTVTAITRAAAGTGYTSFPSVAITAPTTAGGVQATASVVALLTNNPTTIQSGGTGYTLNDTLTIVGGTPSSVAATYTVTGVSGGVVTSVTALNFAQYTALPTNPVSTTGGTGSGCTLNLVYGIASNNPFTITNAGSGYVEQPTVTFSGGGGGSGAAAYASVGSTPVIRSIASQIAFATANGDGLRVSNSGTTNVNFASVQGNSTGAAVLYGAGGSDANIGVTVSSFGTGSVSFRTNNVAQEQMRVSHTASAVNYVQATGNSTGNGPIISAQGSDTNVDLLFSTKGTAGSHVFRTNSTVRQFQINHVTSAVNYGVVTGSITGNAIPYSVAGTDANISQVFQPKGTGAIDLAAGSSGVNVSNGGTVTAITRTSAGSGYTSQPTVAISAPTTAGGVQATATVNIVLAAVSSIANGGTGYTAGDVLTISGGTSAQTAQLTVSTVSGGVITAVTVSRGGDYTVAPANPASVTGGTGTGATFNLTFGVLSTFTITNAGSGYVEQPTVSFSGGGGSGAAAYAVVGSVSTIRGIGVGTTSNGNTIRFVGPSGVNQLELWDVGGADSWLAIQNTQFSRANVIAQGNSNAQLWFSANGSGFHAFATGGTSLVNQMRVSHTASAVNYVQVTGAATTAFPTISAQGSDANIGLNFRSKGNFNQAFADGSGSVGFLIDLTGATTGVATNYLSVTRGPSGTSPSLKSAGTDTNINLTLTPKGTGRVQFGTHTGTVDTAISGYIEILDSGGTVRRLAVIT